MSTIRVIWEYVKFLRILHILFTTERTRLVVYRKSTSNGEYEIVFVKCPYLKCPERQNNQHKTQ